MDNKKAYTKSFASIYDDVMGAVPYNFWYDYLHELLRFYHLNPSKVLELACGTGTMSFLFARDGYLVTALDKSPDMLTIAREKSMKRAFQVNFIEADLINFDSEGQFDLIFSLFDSLNYILQLKNLKRVFQNVYNSLDNQGAFIFDMNTPQRLMSINPATTIITGDNYTCVWEDIIDQQKLRWQVRLKIYLEEQEEYYEEFHQETGYPVEDVMALLKNVGFNWVEVYNAYTFEKGNDNDNRLYYLALKEKPNIKKRGILTESIYRVKWKFKKGLASSE